MNRPFSKVIKSIVRLIWHNFSNILQGLPNTIIPGESQISKPNDQEVAVIVGETSEANKGEKNKKEEEQTVTERVNINQRSKLKGYRTQRVPQESILEWARDILERRRDEPYDTAGDITKKVRMAVPDFEGRVDPTIFSDWIASIEEYFDWYDMADNRREWVSSRGGSV
ncbi:hypothetical protein CMV_021002 [Castanea mollissima]|uniref:Uncharacterized protein n=1 Tax=Castanea mollissima TaxID=60419 RepID=A0A8J4QXX9_9ROSI|nr:hypothetical protein CMV_021002 [Castanea mollissima]